MAAMRPNVAPSASILYSSPKRAIISSSTPHLPLTQHVCPSAWTTPSFRGGHHLQVQVRHATFLRRPKRPYTFTQMVTLSDGSSYLHRTSSPAPIHKSIKDQRNAPLWNPSSAHLQIIEADVAGRLRAFRAKFGRGWDMADGRAPEVAREAADTEQDGARELSGENDARDATDAAADAGRQRDRPDDPLLEDGSLLDLISGFKMNEDVERGLNTKKPKRTPGGGGGKKKK